MWDLSSGVLDNRADPLGHSKEHWRPLALTDPGQYRRGQASAQLKELLRRGTRRPTGPVQTSASPRPTPGGNSEPVPGLSLRSAPRLPSLVPVRGPTARALGAHTPPAGCRSRRLGCPAPGCAPARPGPRLLAAPSPSTAPPRAGPRERAYLAVGAHRAGPQQHQQQQERRQQEQGQRRGPGRERGHGAAGAAGAAGTGLTASCERGRLRSPARPRPARRGGARAQGTSPALPPALRDLHRAPRERCREGPGKFRSAGGLQASHVDQGGPVTRDRGPWGCPFTSLSLSFPIKNRASLRSSGWF